MSEVIERREGVISPALHDTSLPRALKQIYANRGVDNVNDILLPLNQLLPPSALKGAQEAAEMLADAIEFQASVVIVGDFDADGDLDLVLGGNLYRAKPEVGIYDASHGLYLDNVKGVFKISSRSNDFNIKGEIRDIKRIDNQVFVFRSNDSIAVLNVTR